MWIVWPFRKKNFGSAWAVCADFRRFIEDTIGEFIIRDEKTLPHPKTLIFESMCIQLLSETDERTLDSIKLCAFELAFFQPGVGGQPLHPLGIDIDRQDLEGRGAESFGISARADLAGKEKYDRFKLLRDAEWERMKTTMEQILRRRR